VQLEAAARSRELIDAHHLSAPGAPRSPTGGHGGGSPSGSPAR
jgi:hypothetical protein